MTRQHYLFLFVCFKLSGGEKKCLLFKKTKELKNKTPVPLSFTASSEQCSWLVLSGCRENKVLISILGIKSLWRDSVVSGPSFLHARSFGFGDVLVVGLVLQLSAEVLDGFVQALLQGHLSMHNITVSSARAHTKKENAQQEKDNRLQYLSFRTMSVLVDVDCILRASSCLQRRHTIVRKSQGQP